MRPPSVGPDDDCHQDRSTQYTNSNSALLQNSSQQQSPKLGAWGDDINTISDEDVCFIFQNVNGITSSTGLHEALKSKMVALGGTVTALAETNVNWQNFNFCDKWETLLQQSYASLHFSHSSCDEGKRRKLQRGGTSMVCNYRLGAKLMDKGCDSLLGRWSWMKFRGRQGTKVLIITAYQVSQTSAQGLGMDTVYMQHWQKLAKANAAVNPRAQFWADLTMFIQTATAAHTEVLVMMDANADITDSGFADFLIACGLHDLHTEDGEVDPPPETYYRGKRKIDFCLGTNGVAHAVTRAGITSYEGGLKYSDHWALFVDINEELLFTSKGVDPTAQKGRDYG